MSRRFDAHLVFALALGAITIGCEADGRTAGPLSARLRGCGLLSGGTVGATTLERFYAPDACYQDCLGSGSCDELAGVLCGTSIALPLRCDERCALRCDDGSLIGVEALCNGVAQCADGTDEEGCERVECGDGTGLPQSARCDGWAQCSDGADEAGCPTCDGAVLESWMRCNGSAECDDGNDERGCPTYTCANGVVVTNRYRDPRCDGSMHCDDGSDEEGCASLTPMCDGS